MADHEKLYFDIALTLPYVAQLLLLLGVPGAFLVTPWLIEHPLAALVPAALALVPPTSLFLQPALAAAAHALMHMLYSATGAARAPHAASEPFKPQV